MTRKEYFDDKIDWRFLNYLIDNLTKYEDEGNLFSICVNLEINARESWIVYLYNINYNTYIDAEQEMPKEYIGKKNIVYTVQASVSNKDPYALNRFYKNVESRCNFFGRKNNTYAEIKPK